MARFEGRNLSQPIPERIREAREAQGLTLDTFAEHLDVSRQAVAQYETGQISPSGKVMGRIIYVTSQPLSYFVSKRNRSSDGVNVFWRSLKRMKLADRKRIARRLEWASDIVSYIEQFINLPDVDIPVPPFDPNDDDFYEIEEAADLVRKLWDLGRGPIRDLGAIVESRGILLIRDFAECDDMDAVSCWQGARPFILLSTEIESGPRDKWNLAHELGHILLHSGVHVVTTNLNKVEKQANRFAGALLLPQETFSQEVFGTSIESFEYLKARWGVSIAAMAYRCKDLEILSATQHQYLMKQMNVRRIRKVEPLDDAFPVNKPTVLPEAIRMLVERGVQTKKQLEDALCLGISDIERLCGVEPGYLNTTVVPFMPRPKRA